MLHVAFSELVVSGPLQLLAPVCLQLLCDDFALGVCRTAHAASKLTYLMLGSHMPLPAHAIQLGYFYYLFGFVLLVGLLTMIINAEIAVLCTYVQLCAEDYSWW